MVARVSAMLRVAALRVRSCPTYDHWSTGTVDVWSNAGRIVVSNHEVYSDDGPAWRSHNAWTVAHGALALVPAVAAPRAWRRRVHPGGVARP